MSQQTFASTEEVLAHYGRKGMRWGIRNEEESKNVVTQKTDSEKKAARRATAKKVAIGTGVLVGVAGAGFVAYKLHQSGKLPISTIKKKASPKAVPQVKKIIEQTDILHASRAKESGFRFWKSGGFPSPLSEYESVFGADKMQEGVRKLTDGRTAASFYDPLGRKDFSGRPIPHQVIIPKALSAGLNTIEDVVREIWPKLEDTYDYGRKAGFG